MYLSAGDPDRLQGNSLVGRCCGQIGIVDESECWIDTVVFHLQGAAFSLKVHFESIIKAQCSSSTFSNTGI